VGCDFADIFEVRGFQRERRGQFYAPQRRRATAELRLPRPRREPDRTSVRFAEPPRRSGHAPGALALAAGAKRSRWIVEWEVAFLPVRSSDPGVDAPHGERRASLEAIYAEWRGECSQWRPTWRSSTRRSAGGHDLRALYVEAGGERSSPPASPGTPRSSGATPSSPRSRRSAEPPHRRRHAPLPGAPPGGAEDPFTEEQPGKIMHELRRGEMARAGEIPHVPYYGTIDATPLWLILLHETWRWTGDDALVRELLPHAERALEWIDRYGDIDGDGFVEYPARRRRGSSTRGGRTRATASRSPTAPCRSRRSRWWRCRGTSTTPRLRMARSSPPSGRSGRRAEGRRPSAAPADPRRFWLEELGTFALALDGRTSGRSHRHHQRRAPPLEPGSRPEQARRMDGCTSWPRDVLRLGAPDAERRAPGLQPDELPQRLGLAARQRDRRAGHRAQRPYASGAAGAVGAARRRERDAVPPPARAVLRHESRVRGHARALPGKLLSRRPGPPELSSCSCRP
jgi:hypothetical protein